LLARKTRWLGRLGSIWQNYREYRQVPAICGVAVAEGWQNSRLRSR
jgi:hypothetical protein